MLKVPPALPAIKVSRDRLALKVFKVQQVQLAIPETRELLAQLALQVRTQQFLVRLVQLVLLV